MLKNVSELHLSYVHTHPCYVKPHPFKGGKVMTPELCLLLRPLGQLEMFLKGAEQAILEDETVEDPDPVVKTGDGEDPKDDDVNEINGKHSRGLFLPFVFSLGTW